MRFLLLFAFFAVTYSFPINDDKVFNEIYEFTLSIFQSQGNRYPFNYLKNANQQCMKEKLKLSENGHKLVSQSNGVFAVVSAAMLCVEDQNGFYGYIYDSHIAMIQGLRTQIETESVICLKKRLQELEPDSELLTGFDANNLDKDECSLITSLVEFEINNTIKELQNKAKQLGITQCLNLNLDEIRASVYRLTIVIFEEPQNDKALKKEKEINIDNSKKQTEKLFECTMNKIEERFRINENLV